MRAHQIEPDRSEIWRYLGYHGQEPDEQIRQRTEYCIDRLDEVITPGFVSMDCTLRFLAQEQLQIGEMTIKSESLARHLQGCQGAVLFAATLGTGPDRLIKRASVSAVSDMLLYQAAGAAMIEAYCDGKNGEIRRELEEKGFCARTRFSPGYGDFPLAHQEEILRMLQAPKRIALTVTGSMMMAPSKSVTALIGYAADGARKTGSIKTEACGMTAQADGTAHRCELCGMTSCPYRS